MTVPDDVYRAARIQAAERGSSVSALVTGFLRSVAFRDAEFERLRTQQLAVQQQVRGFSARDRLSRDRAHDRALR
ncbi:MAG: hypothetical protein ACRCY9_07190 [Phycicoccus sp.]